MYASNAHLSQGDWASRGVGRSIGLCGQRVHVQSNGTELAGIRKEKGDAAETADGFHFCLRDGVDSGSFRTKVWTISKNDEKQI